MINCKIGGVKFIKIKSHNDKRGFFREIFRLDDDYNEGIKFKQISHSKIDKNVHKGWHFHKKQYQWNYLLSGKIKLYLLDNRIKSVTYKKVFTKTLDSKSRILYLFPPHIGHAYKTLSKENHMIYATSGYYKVDEEYKLTFK
jgi:dTDP-4-dehydrorhamnose 3,5-epimerase